MTSKKGCQDHHLVADNEDHLCIGKSDILKGMLIGKVQHTERHPNIRVEYTAIRRNA